MVFLKDTSSLLAQAAREWSNDDPWRHGAIIAYYAIFSMPGLLLLVIWTAGAIFGQAAVQGQVSSQIQEYLGCSAAEGVEQIIANAELTQNNIWMKLLGLGTLIFGATTLFLQLQKSLNEIWEVKTAPQNAMLKLLTDRATSFGIILVIAFLMLVTLILSIIISIVSVWIEAHLGSTLLVLIRALNFVLSIGLITSLFAIIFKVLPDVEINWRSVWVGAFTAALLFTVGKTILGLYFSYADPGSSFGAAGTIILIMLWVNYTCLILFFGAKLSQVYAVKRGHPIKPSSHAQWTAEHLIKHTDESSL